MYHRAETANLDPVGMRESHKGGLHQHLAAQVVVGMPGHLAWLPGVQAAEAVQHLLGAPMHVAHCACQLPLHTAYGVLDM